MKSVLFEMYRDGAFHQWFPYQFMGYPTAADLQMGAFYPLNIIGLIPSFPLAFKIFVLIHYPLAALTMFALLKGRGLSNEASSLGGVGFALSGHLLCTHGYLTMLIGAAWAPLAVHFFLSALDGRKPVRETASRAVASGAVLAVMLLGGDPQTCAFTALVITILAVWASIAGSWRRAVPALAVAGGASIALSLVQLLLALEILRGSGRMGGLPLEQGAAFSVNPWRLPEIILDPVRFNPVIPSGLPLRSFSTSRLDAGYFPYSYSLYLGPIIAILAAIGLAAGKSRGRYPIIAAMIILLFLSLGDHTPVFPLFHRFVPGFDRFRFPEKYMTYFSAFAAIAAAMGLETVIGWIRVRPWVLRKTGRAFFILFPAAAVAGCLLFPFLLQADSIGGWLLLLLHWLIPGTALAVCLSLMARSGKKWAAALTLCVAADLFCGTVIHLAAGPDKVYETASPVTKAIKAEMAKEEKGPFRIYRMDIAYPANWGAGPGLDDYQKQMLFSRLSLYGGLANLDRLELLAGYNSVPPVAGNDFLSTLHPGELLRYNVGFLILAEGNDPPEGTTRIFDDSQAGLQALRLDAALPRAFWTADDVLAGPAPETSMIPARVEYPSPDHAEVSVDAPADGWLILNDRYHPGWKTWVDGKSEEIVPANHLARAVRVTAGRHEVRFEFRSRPLRLGAWVSLPAWILAAGLWIGPWLIKNLNASRDGQD